MSLPDDFDAERIAEMAMALMYLAFHGEGPALRAWKSLDWDVLELLHEKGWISDPKSKARSVGVTQEGERQGKMLFERNFLKQSR